MRRQSGRTSAQMKRAERGAVFVWCNADLSYPRALARSLCRDDIEIQPPAWLDRRSKLGWPARMIIVDHACELTREQHDGLMVAIDSAQRRLR